MALITFDPQAETVALQGGILISPLIINRDGPALCNIEDLARLYGMPVDYFKPY